MKTWFIKQVFGQVFKAILNKYDLDSFKNYVENDNELDIKTRDHEDRIRKLEQDSHPVADFVCTEHGCKATRIQDEMEDFRARKINEYNNKKKKRRMAP